MRELCRIFGRDESVLNRFFLPWAVKHVFENFSHLLITSNARFYTREFFQGYAWEKGCEFRSCFVFWTARWWKFYDRVAKRLATAVFLLQKVSCLQITGSYDPNGLILHLDGPYVGKHHDSNVLSQSSLLNRVRSLNERLGVSLSDRLRTHADRAYQRSLFVVQPSRTLHRDHTKQNSTIR